jgi:hypothetical protein
MCASAWNRRPDGTSHGSSLLPCWRQSTQSHVTLAGEKLEGTHPGAFIGFNSSLLHSSLLLRSHVVIAHLPRRPDDFYRRKYAIGSSG